MPAVFTVDASSGVPIYVQIVQQIKRFVALGVLAAGEQLPTVKQLAVDLTVNPNTVARAYRDLERDGVIETAVGRGSFVRSDGSGTSSRAAANDVAAQALLHAVREAKSMGMTSAQVRGLFEAALTRWFPEKA
jgi:GntR family transcriptional regulator